MKPILNKRQLFLQFIPFFIAIVFISFYVDSKNEKKNEELAKVMLKGINNGHFKPLPLDDKFSNTVYDLYLKRIDYTKKFLTQADIAQLKKYQNQIDDELKNGTYKFYNTSVELLITRTKEAQTYYQEILEKPFDFKAEEKVDLDYEKISFAKNSAELKDAWRKYLKYQVLTRLVDAMEAQEKAKEKSDTVTLKTVEYLEEDARKKVLKSYNDWFTRMVKDDHSDRLSRYLNAVTSVYDPHTIYLRPEDKKQFDISMSGRLEGIGATLQEKDGYIKVTAIVVGSASWKQGQLKVGDVILKVAQAEADPVDIVDMRLDNAVQLIRGKKGTEVRLTVKKVDGSIIVIPIVRDVVIIEETYSKSALIKKDKNIGYIDLPSFYADFNNVGSRSCSDDIRKEIIKLKQENVSGIILDLRSNSGGSLQDVVTMMGYFIEKGPIVQVKSKDAAPYILEDHDPQVQYDGPLVVMVNYSSASASEILAAAVQDYKRGVVIGSNTTFGKGSVQRIFNMDDWLVGGDSLKPLGSVKLTTQKFYRVNGGATQLKGVVPDIILPDNYSYIKTGEKEEDNAMPWDKIPAAKYNAANKNIDFNKIKEKSKLRTKNNAVFTLINENAMRLKKQSDDKSYNLNLKKYREEQTKDKEDAKKYNDIFKEISDWTIYASSSDMTEKSDTLNISKRNEWFKTIKKDAYIYEAVQVINDLQ